MDATLYQKMFDRMTSETIDGVSVNDIIGGGDARGCGEIILQSLLSEGAITHASHVLDVGSGCGRAAVPIGAYLEGGSGTYTGIDIIPRLIDFSRQHISAELPNTAFYAVRESNPLYDSHIDHGDEKLFASDEQIWGRNYDVIIAFSVFTHLDEDAAQAMLARIHASLADGGAAMLSFFVLDEYSREHIRLGNTPFFREAVRLESVAIDTFNGKLSAVGFDDRLLRGMIREAGFEGIYAQHNGVWRSTLGRQFQDVIVLKKAAALPADFDGEAYRAANPDVRTSGVDPALHYRVHGHAEGRALRP